MKVPLLDGSEQAGGSIKSWMSKQNPAKIAAIAISVFAVLLYLSEFASLFSISVIEPVSLPGSQMESIDTNSTSLVRKQVLIVTLYSSREHPEYVDMKNLTWPNKVAYAERHGYGIVDAYDYPLVQKFNGPDIGSNRQYLKLVSIISALEDTSRPDWILWTDSDSIFLNFSKTVDEHLDERYNLILNGCGKPPLFWKVINSGVMFIKNTPFSRDFFTYLWQHALIHPNECPKDKNGHSVDDTHPLGVMNGWLHFCNGGNVWLNDQGLIMLTLRVSPRELLWHYPSRNDSLDCHVKYVGNRDFNSVPGWYLPGDFIIHLPGKQHEERVKIFKEFLRLTDFNNGSLDYMLSQDLILKPNFFYAADVTPDPSDWTDDWEGKHGWNYTEAPCQENLV
ncbi:hypothetical protein SmJEL517_g02910 [Synchytrium microbalum]|uniref:Nucleotide-diphospho-sugar transferase domain-containing protein n=1 Tax=Synchytrium microbalum TaxID=1806994 RepID=A0A507CAC3_9FUNG|nr:uncharacterized protein SmJEL517_g02910 [Synchytrium microbalum]TPX34455.1 hypothetical protein SmJEL517_g02910 [Synchytrium microbalum]